MSEDGKIVEEDIYIENQIKKYCHLQMEEREEIRDGELIRD